MEGDGKRPTILAVDDEPILLDLIKESLELEGYTVVQAKDAIAALELFKEVRPSVVITDIKMPGMSGISLSKKIREMDGSVGIVLISGHEEFRDFEASSKEVFLKKPFNIWDLISAVEAVSPQGG